MNRPLLLGIAILALVAALFFVFSGSDDLAGRTPTPTPPLKAIIIPVESEVLVKQPQDVDFVVIKKETEIRADTEIKTSATGRARIFYPNGTITNVENDTYLRVKKFDNSGSQSKLRLITGSVWVKVKNVLGKGEFYEIETENVVANVRGTVFGIQFRNGTTQVIGVQHSVRVDGWNPGIEQAIMRVGTMVDPREKLTVSGPVTATSPAFRTDFIMPADLQNEEIKDNMIDLLEPAEAQDPMIRGLIEEVRELNPNDAELIRQIELKGLLATPTPVSVQVDTSVKIEVSGLPQVRTTPTPTP